MTGRDDSEFYASLSPQLKAQFDSMSALRADQARFAALTPAEQEAERAASAIKADITAKTDPANIARWAADDERKAKIAEENRIQLEKDMAANEIAQAKARAEEDLKWDVYRSPDTLAGQILASTDPNLWSGEGFGSSRQNAADMARVLWEHGITDVSQFGVRNKVIPGGTEIVAGDGVEFTNYVPDRTVQEYYNKRTDQVINPGYDRAGGNIWSGTFAGQGSTGYGVQFDEAGKPYFYTQFGGSTNDFANLMSNPIINFAANAAAGITGGPVGIAALQAATAVANGGDINDAIAAGVKGYALSSLGQSAGKYVGGLSEGAGTAAQYGTDLGSQQTAMLAASELGMGTATNIGSQIAGNVAGQYVGSGGKIDPVQALISNGLSAGTNAVLSNIDGFSSLSPTAQSAITNTVSSTLRTGELNPMQAAKEALRVASSMANEAKVIDPYFQTGAGTGALPTDYATNDVGAQQLIDAFTNTASDTGPSIQVAGGDMATALESLQSQKQAEEAGRIGGAGSGTFVDSLGRMHVLEEGEDLETEQARSEAAIAEEQAAAGPTVLTKDETAEQADELQKQLAAFETPESQSAGTDDEFYKSIGIDPSTLTPSQNTTGDITGADQTLESVKTGMTPEETAATDWAALYATPTTNPETGETIVGGDPADYANQDLQITDENWDSYTKNLQDIVDNKGGFTSQWQTSGGDRVLVNDDGTGIGINENGDSYELTGDQIDQMIDNGQLNTAGSGYVEATGGTGDTPGGSEAVVKPGTTTTTTTTPAATTTTPVAKTPAATTTTPVAKTPAEKTQTSTSSGSAVSGQSPSIGGGANIKSFKELFGHDLFDDAGQEFSSGGNVDDFSVDALLQILRS